MASTFNIQNFRLPQPFDYHAHIRERLRKAEIFGADYATEKAASELVRSWLAKQRWSYEVEAKTKSGKSIDYIVTAKHGDRDIRFGIEVKRHLSTHWQFKDGLSATTLADHLEQAAAYSRDLSMPVFIGPIQSNASPSTAFTGGINVDSVCALNIFGGRMNVGTLVLSDRQEYMILRGATFWEQGSGFNEKRLNIVTSTGSAKERKSI
jgi:hypothetical protein